MDVIEKIFFALERIYKMTHIPVRCFDNSGEIVLFVRGYEGNDEAVDSAARERIVSKLENANAPVLEFEEKIIYGACYDTMKNIIVFGPAIETLNVMSASISMFMLSINNELVFDLDITASKYDNQTEEVKKNSYKEYVLGHNEEGEPRFNYSDEMLFLKHIKEGNPEAVRQRASRRVELLHEYRVGKLAKQSLKQNEYMACSAIVLASRAAVEGGIDPLTGYLMSDTYLQRLENCTDVNSIYRIVHEMTVAFAEQVKEHIEQRSRHSYVEQCRQFIFKHLSKQFTNDEVASELAVSKQYLCRLFADEVGMGIQQYAVYQRIEAAMNMLKFSDASISTVAMYFCFASQSHFGKVFKKHTGLSPKQFRDINKPIDFQY